VPDVPTYLETLSKRDLVAEEVSLLRLRQEERTLQHLEANARTVALLESHDPWASSDPLRGGQAIPAGLGSAPNDLFHPTALGFHAARPGSRRDGALPPYYRTEMDHWRIVDAARIVEALCPTAVSVLEVLEQFAIFTGFSYKVTRKKEPGDQAAADRAPGARALASDDEGSAEPKPVESDPEQEAAQDFLDRWMKRERWDLWEKEIFRRTRRDGEAFLVMDDGEAGLGVHLRSLEPEQIKQPQDRPARNRDLDIGGGESWRFGILTTREDTAVPLGYWAVSQFSEAANLGTFYEAEDMIHVKINVDRQAKRGISDFFSNMNDFPGVRKLLRALRESATVQANIAGIKAHAQGVMPEAVGDQQITTRGGLKAESVTYNHPTYIGVPQGTEFTAGPLGLQGRNSALILVLQAALRNIGARWQMPESLVSGDASNNNLASELAVAAPFVHAMECRQAFYGEEYSQILERVLEQASMDGLIGSADGKFLDTFEVTVEMPPVIPRNAKEETDRNAVLSDHGILGNASWSAREDLDREDELQDMEEDPITPPMIGIMGPDDGTEDGEEVADQPSGEKADTPNVRQPRKPKTGRASSIAQPESGG
jgi:hypothetical protein